MAAAKKGGKPKVAAVRFSAGLSADGPPNHVRFDEKLHDSVVTVSEEEDGTVLVKVGFLKILHKYEISFSLPAIQRLGRNLRAAPLPCRDLAVTAIAPLAEGHRVRCEYTARREGVLKEEVVLASEADEKTFVKVVVQARVLDRHHGTPMLLEGVKCVGAEPEYDSEQSDWHGFD